MVSSSSLRKAMVTFTIGNHYDYHFDRYFAKNLKDYCEKYHYDFIRIREPLDTFRYNTRANGILMQKLLINTQSWSDNYDYIVWIDADVYVTKHAEDIVNYCLDTDKICGTNQSNQVNRRMRLYNQISRGYEQTAQKWYLDRGIYFNHDDVFRSGLMVFQPKKHKELCLEIYQKTIKDPMYLKHGEDMPFISYEFLKRDLIKFLDWDFQAVWDLHYDFVKNTGNDSEKIMILSRLMFISHMIHFASMLDTAIIEPAEKLYDKYSSKIKSEQVLIELFTSHKLPLNECPINLNHNLNQWKTLNRQFYFNYYDDNQMNLWMNQHCDQETLEVYNLLNTGAGKADLFRICKLYYTGGLWVDADLPAFDIVNNRKDFIELATTYQSLLVKNRKCFNPRYTFIYSKAGHPLFKKLIKQIIANIHSYRNQKLNTIHVTGPFVLHKLICQALELSKIEQLEAEQVYNLDDDEGQFIYISDLITERSDYETENVYVGYQQDLKSMQVNHHTNTNFI